MTVYSVTLNHLVVPQNLLKPFSMQNSTIVTGSMLHVCIYIFVGLHYGGEL